MVVDLEELRAVIDAIFSHVSKDLNIKKVNIEENFYWNVDSETLFRFREKPPGTDLGSLHDDWEFLRDILEDKDQAVALMLVHVAPILRYIGEKVASPRRAQ